MLDVEVPLADAKCGVEQVTRQPTAKFIEISLLNPCVGRKVLYVQKIMKRA